MKLMKLLTEAQVDTPGQVMKKAQLAKVRADAQRLGQQQKTLAQNKKNIKDTPTKRRISKQMADIGVKKADLGVKAADMGTQLKKKPTMEAKINEGAVGPEDDVFDIAKHDKKFYAKRDARGAISAAIKEYIKGVTQDMLDDLEMQRTLMERELRDYWVKQEKHK